MADIPYAALGFADPVSSWLHLLGAGALLLFGVFLVRKARGNTARIIALILFVFCGVFALSMSGVYHLLAHGGTPRMVLQRLDHAGVFALIAGTFTAVHVLLFKGAARWFFVALVWIIAATAIPLKTVFFNDMPEWLSLTLYIGMGWLGLGSAVVIYRRHGLALLRLLLGGGLAYTLGAVLEFLRWPILIPRVIGPHELFHVGVLVGLAYHCRLIWDALDHQPDNPGG